MSDEFFSGPDQQTMERLAAAILQELEAGGRPEDIVRELNASGWTKEAAEQFVESVHNRWQQVRNSPEVLTAQYLQTRFPDMRPIRSAPTLFTINGIGMMMYGARDKDPETNTYVETHSLCVLFLPVVALGAYRVARAEDGGRYVLGKVPLSGLAKAWNWSVLCALLAAIAYGGWKAHTSSDDYRARSKLARADEAAEAGKLVEASQLYGELGASPTRHAVAAREKLAGLVTSEQLDELPLEDASQILRIAVQTPAMGAASEAVFDRGLEFVSRHVETNPQGAVELLGVIAPLSPSAASETFLALADQQLADLPAEETLAIFRTAASMPCDATQRRAISERGLHHCTRLASANLSTALALLQELTPLAESAAVQDHWDRLLGEPLDRVSCVQVGPILAVAKDIDVPESETKVIARGRKWLDDHPATDPREALALIDQLAEYPSADGDWIREARRGQLERIVAADPQDMQAAIQLSLLLEPDGDVARIEALLSPHRGKLGTDEGARLLGQLLADQGKWDEAYALLGPYLDERLEAFHQAEQTFEDALSRVQQRVIAQLQQGTARDFSYALWENASESEQRAMVDEYINSRLRDDASVTEASERLSELSSVVPAALDLGMVMLYRAQAMGDPQARQAELERAEKTFLAVRGVAGDTDQYRLHLGQVYYWLGRHDEGHEQLEELLAAHERSHSLLMAVAMVLRNLGAAAESRQLLEEAYDKAGNDDERHAAAHLRGITNTDLEDKITWLERSDPDAAETKAILACARGDRAAGKGEDEEAATYYREAITIYEDAPQVAATYNNGALAYLSLFQVSGDREAFDRGLEWLQKAVALSPSDSLVLGNAAHTLIGAALQDLAGTDLNLRELYQLDSIAVLNYLADDSTSLEAIRERARQHAGLNRALSYLDQAMVLSPKNPGSYVLAIQIRGYLRDEEALERLATRLRETSPDLQEMNERYRGHCRYEDDESDQQARASALNRMESLIERYGDEPARPALAVAVGRLVELNLDAMDLQAIDADRLVELAERAHTAAPSRGTYRPLIDALMFRAGRSLAQSFPEYAEMTRLTARSLPPGYLMPLTLARNEPWGQAARNHQDVQQAAELTRQLWNAYPDAADYGTWALLRVTHADEAEAVAGRLAEDRVDQLEREIRRRLFPHAAYCACSEYWEHLAAGDTEAARRSFQPMIEAGIPFPMALIEGADPQP